jgi:hypothetical protein
LKSLEVFWFKDEILKKEEKEQHKRLPGVAGDGNYGLLSIH